MGIEGIEREGYREKSEDTDDVEEELREALHEESKFQELKKDIEEMLSELEEEEFHRRVRRMMRELRDEERIRREIREASDKSESSEKEVGEADKPREKPEVEDGHQESSDVKGEVNEGHAQESYHESGDGTVYVTQQEAQLESDESEPTEKPEVEDDIEKEKTASEVEGNESKDSSTEVEEPASEVEQQREIADEIPDGEGQEKESTSTTEESENSEQSEVEKGEQDSKTEMDIRAETPEPSSEGRREMKEETSGSEREREEIEAIPTEVSEEKVAQEELDEGENRDEKELDEEELTRRIRDLLEELEKEIREKIRTKEDLDRAIEEHPEVRDDPYFESAYEIACEYLEFKRRVRERYTEEQLEEMSHVEVARELGYTISDASFWLHDREVPSLLERLYRLMREERLRELLDIVDEGGVGEGDAETNHLREIPPEKLEQIFENPDSKEWSTDTLDHLVQALQEGLSDKESSIVYANLKRLQDLSQGQLERIGELVEQWREARADLSEETHETDTRFELRIALVDGRLYLWKRNLVIDDLTNAYGHLYFYFRNYDLFKTYIESAEQSLNFKENKAGKHLGTLLSQMLPEKQNEICINKRILRIRGDHIQFINNLSGRKLGTMNGQICKITEIKGKGGIINPIFFRGEELRVAISRLTATIISDGSIAPNGVLQYAEEELERIYRVIANVKKFGEIYPRVKFVERSNHYLMHLPFVLGQLLIHTGISTGDKTINNPELSILIKEGSDRVKRAYLEDLIPEDGCVGSKTIIWVRAMALHAGPKTERYEFQPKVGPKEIDMIVKYGNKYEDTYTLSWGELQNLTRSKMRETSELAKKLKKIVENNPSNLLHDEVMIATELGVNVLEYPTVIHYYSGSGRVTVAWHARTKGVKNAIMLGIVSPPNDIRKRNKMRKMMSKYREVMNEVIRELKKKGVDFHRWW